jgi:phage terminase small subunit
MKLITPKQEAFVREYLVDLNATKAAIRAGYSPKTAAQTGAENLTKPVIQARIEAAMEERAQKVEVTAEQVLARLWLEANRQGKGASHAARIRALELVGRHVGLKFTEGLELGGPGGGPIPVASTVDLKALSAEELATLAAILTKAKGPK